MHAVHRLMTSFSAPLRHNFADFTAICACFVRSRRRKANVCRCFAAVEIVSHFRNGAVLATAARERTRFRSIQDAAFSRQPASMPPENNLHILNQRGQNGSIETQGPYTPLRSGREEKVSNEFCRDLTLDTGASNSERIQFAFQVSGGKTDWAAWLVASI